MRQDEQQVNKDQPEAVRSAPVSVEKTTNGSYRAGRTDVPEDALEDRGTFDDPTVAGERVDGGAADGSRHRSATDRDDAGRDGRPEFHEPGPVPTAFGATTVGGAVAASALAGGRPEDERDPRGEDTAQPGDGAPGRTDRFDAERADPTAADRLHRADASGRAGSTGHPGRHADPADRRDDTVPVTTIPGGPDRTTDRTGPGDAATGSTGYGRPAPTMVDPDADGGSGLGDADQPAGNVPVDAARLFDPGTAQGFRDRWRDVQLRFVDDPKAAAGQAQSLVDEAIQALAAALAAQKEKLGSWQESGSDDTEQLRVAVRHYRDFLDRVLGR
ncbi:hypothetical protein [Micromonospora fluostatini]|uniref:hypothetical protein n=1 Tax=Micromonospora sp. JCM 30529 TaxID=3421643 RepID=UPI003D177212